MDAFPLENMHVSRCSDLRGDGRCTDGNIPHVSVCTRLPCRRLQSPIWSHGADRQSRWLWSTGLSSSKRRHKQVFVLKVIYALTLLKGICEGSFDGGRTAWFRYRDRQLQQNLCHMWKDQNEPLMGWTDLLMSEDIWKSPAAEHHKKHPIVCFELSQACGYDGCWVRSCWRHNFSTHSSMAPVRGA